LLKLFKVTPWWHASAKARPNWITETVNLLKLLPELLIVVLGEP